MIGKVATKPVINSIVNAANKNGVLRGLLDKTMGIHKDAKLPEYTNQPARKKLAAHIYDPAKANADTGIKFAQVTLFTTCYCNYNEPSIADSVIKVLEHNNIKVNLGS